MLFDLMVARMMYPSICSTPFVFADLSEQIHDKTAYPDLLLLLQCQLKLLNMVMDGAASYPVLHLFFPCAAQLVQPPIQLLVFLPLNIDHQIHFLLVIVIKQGVFQTIC